MPVSGRKQKLDAQGNRIARTRHEPTTVWAEVPDLPYTGRVPKMGRRTNGSWSERAKRKWAVWSRMPHCRLWGPAEWDFALDSLEVAQRFYEGDRAAATELRNREKQLGTTADYRRDLRIRYIDPDAVDMVSDLVEEGSVANLDDWRATD